MEDLTNSTPQTGETATQEIAPETTTGTVPTNGEANGVAPDGEETFTKVDPKNLPPQLRQSYNDMLRDYKEKTQKISETVKAEVSKAAEAYRQKSELYDQIASQEAFVQKWNDYVKEVQSKEQQPEPGDPKLTQLEEKVQEMNQKLQLAEMSQITDAFAEAVDEKGNKLHSDFDDLNTIQIGKIGGNEDFSLLRACIELATGNTPQEKLTNGYKVAKEAYSRIFEAGKKAGMGRVQSKIMNSSQPPTHSGGDVLSITDKKPKNAREALELARKGVMVSRD